MQRLNIEIKARTTSASGIRAILTSHKAKFIGKDHQVDTYFKVPNGRLKLREGNIENHLIHYQRVDQKGPKQSEVLLYRPNNSAHLKEILTTSLGIFIVVDKVRSIFFIDNVKFHLDEVQSLGSFVEIEAIDKDGTISSDTLLQQCKEYMQLFDIKEQDLISQSYSDLLASNASL